jgi:hypothetical protein
VLFSIETSNALFNHLMPWIFTVLVVGRITLLHNHLSFIIPTEETAKTVSHNSFLAIIISSLRWFKIC